MPICGGIFDISNYKETKEQNQYMQEGLYILPDLEMPQDRQRKDPGYMGEATYGPCLLLCLPDPDQQWMMRTRMNEQEFNVSFFCNCCLWPQWPLIRGYIVLLNCNSHNAILRVNTYLMCILQFSEDRDHLFALILKRITPFFTVSL